MRFVHASLRSSRAVTRTLCSRLIDRMCSVAKCTCAMFLIQASLSLDSPLCCTISSFSYKHVHPQIENDIAYGNQIRTKGVELKTAIGRLRALSQPSNRP